MANETPSRPPPLMANAIKNFHFDFLHPSLSDAQGLDAGIKMALLISVMKTKNCHPKIEDGTDLRILPQKQYFKFCVEVASQ